MTVIGGPRCNLHHISSPWRTDLHRNDNAEPTLIEKEGVVANDFPEFGYDGMVIVNCIGADLVFDFKPQFLLELQRSLQCAVSGADLMADLCHI